MPLVTDGVPNGNSTSMRLPMVAQQALPTARPRSKRTSWVSATRPASRPDRAAGSGGATHYFPATGDVAGQLMAVLKTITGMITCNYAIPMTRPIDRTS